VLPALLPDVLRAGHRDGLAARADLPDPVARRGTHRADRLHRAPSRPLPGLPRVRDGVPLGRALRSAHRGGARGDRAAAAGVLGPAALPLGQLLAAAPPPADARPRRRGAPVLPVERAAAPRPRLGPPAPPARSARVVGAAPAQAAVLARP